MELKSVLLCNRACSAEKLPGIQTYCPARTIHSSPVVVKLQFTPGHDTLAILCHLQEFRDKIRTKMCAKWRNNSHNLRFDLCSPLQSTQAKLETMYFQIYWNVFFIEQQFEK